LITLIKTAIFYIQTGLNNLIFLTNNSKVNCYSLIVKNIRDTMQIKSFEDLECWKACVEVRKFISSLIKKFPSSEKYDLIDNMKRASHSTTRNIAEGYGRFHYKENIQFCRISRGSLFELIDDLITAKDENYILENEYSEGKMKIEKALNILNGYINYLDRAEKNNELRLTINNLWQKNL